METVWEVYKIISGTRHEGRKLFSNYDKANVYCSTLLNTMDYGTSMTTWMHTRMEIDGERHVIYRPMDSSEVEIHIFPRYVH